VHRAGAARRDAAAEFGARQLEMLAQNPERGVLGSTPGSLRTPLTVKATMRSLHLSVKEIFRIS